MVGGIAPRRGLDEKQVQAQTQARTTSASVSALRQLYQQAHAQNSQFAIVLADASGNVRLDGTEGFRPHLQELFTPDASTKAAKLAVEAAAQRARALGTLQQHKHPEKAQEWAQQPPSFETSPTNSGPSYTAVQAPKQKRRKTVQRPSYRRDKSESERETLEVYSEYDELKLCDTETVVSFIETRLRQIQQLACKVIAKSWIKAMEPKKQSNFPYNQGDATRPAWWPRDVRHQEPDHLLKPERLHVMMAIVRSRRVTIEKLENATAEVQPSIPPERMVLLEEVYKVCRQEIRVEKGELPRNTTVYVASASKIEQTLKPHHTTPKVKKEKQKQRKMTVIEHEPLAVVKQEHDDTLDSSSVSPLSSFAPNTPRPSTLSVETLHSPFTSSFSVEPASHPASQDQFMDEAHQHAHAFSPYQIPRQSASFSGSLPGASASTQMRRSATLAHLPNVSTATNIYGGSLGWNHGPGQAHSSELFSSFGGPAVDVSSAGTHDQGTPYSSHRHGDDGGGFAAGYAFEGEEARGIS